MSQNIQQVGGRGRGTFRGRGRGGRGRGGANMGRDQLLAQVAALNAQIAAMDQPPVQQAQQIVQELAPFGCNECMREFTTQNALRQHNASVHGAVIVRKDGTAAAVRDREADRRRAAADLQQRRANGLTPAASAYSPAPPLWVSSRTQVAIRQDPSLRSRSALIGVRETYIVQRKPFTLGNGAGNTLNLLTVAEWSGDKLNSTTATAIPYPIWEFVGLDVVVHGDMGAHGDFALVYYTIAQGANGIGGANTSANSVSSVKRTNLLAMRWSQSLSRHTIITGSGQYFVPADGPGSTIEGAGHLNIISGSSVLNPNAVLVTVTMSAVYAVTGDRA